MMTIKRIDVFGIESVHETSGATYWPEGNEPKDDRPVKRSPSVTWDGGDFRGGTVFLMNSSGATVSRWDLSASPAPLRDDVTGSNVSQKIAA